MQTITSPLTHVEDEHSISVLLSDKATKQATAIQAQLVKLFGDAIWLQQPPALHITLMEIIGNTEYHGMTRQQHFQQWYEMYAQITKEVLADVAPFAITFDQLLVSKRAIIIMAAESRPFNDIREALLAKIRLPEGTKLPPDITHATLARFNRAIDLDDAVQLATGIQVNFTEHIEVFSLVKDLGPPHFNGTPIQTYPLRT